MTTKNRDVDSRGRTIEDEIAASKDAPNVAIANAKMCKTIGKLWHSKKRFSWSTRYVMQDEMQPSEVELGCMFEPVMQFDDWHKTALSA